MVSHEYYASTYDLWKTHVDPSGLNLTTTYSYDTYGNQTSVVDPYGTETQTLYDDTYQCYPKKQTNMQTGVFSESGGYDALGNAGWTRAPRNTGGAVLTTSYTYDGLGRLTLATNPDSTYVQTWYDLNGNTTKVRDENGNEKTFDYDNFGHTKAETGKAQVGDTTTDTDVTVNHCYGELGLLKWVKWRRDGVNKQINYAYDECARLKQETFPGSKPAWFLYRYDAAGHVTQCQESNGVSIRRTIDFTYDELGRPYQDKDGATVLAQQEYFDDGQLKKVSGVNGYIQYGYDLGDRTETCYQSLVNKTLHYVYSTSPHTLRTYIREGNGKTGTILGSYFSEFASGGNLHFLTSPPGDAGGPKTEYVYDNTTYGLLARVNCNVLVAGAPYTTYQYDSTQKKRLWLSSLTNCRSDASVISSFAYQHDLAGNRTRITEANGDYTDYTYDKSYTLRKETRKIPGGSSTYAYDYQYDEIGNRKVKKLTNSLGTKSYNATFADNNLLTGISGAATCSFVYDDFGNQSQRTTGGKTWTYEYDSMNRLTAVKEGATTVSSFKYDALGRRIERTAGGSTVRYVYDGGSVVAETDSANSITAWYTPGVCESRWQGGAWQTFYYHADGLGSTRELTDTLQRVTDAYAYNAWGELHGQLRDASDPNKPVNPLRFVGNEGCCTDDSTGLVLMGARYYDPLLGRFITQDPERDGMNWYAYAGNDPVNAIDPTGLSGRRFGEPVTMGEIQFSRDRYGPLADSLAWSYDRAGNAVQAVGGALGSAADFLFTPTEFDAAVLAPMGPAVLVVTPFERVFAKAAPIVQKVVGRAFLGTPRGRQVFGKALEFAEKQVARHKLFQEGHLLGGLAKRLGGEHAVTREVVKRLVKLRVPNGVFERHIGIRGVSVTVRGNVMDGIPRISTFFVPRP